MAPMLPPLNSEKIKDIRRVEEIQNEVGRFQLLGKSRKNSGKSAHALCEVIDFQLYKPEARMCSFTLPSAHLHAWLTVLELYYRSDERIECETYESEGQIRYRLSVDNVKVLTIHLYVSTLLISVQGVLYQKWGTDHFPVLLESVRSLVDDRDSNVTSLSFVGSIKAVPTNKVDYDGVISQSTEFDEILGSRKNLLLDVPVSVSSSDILLTPPRPRNDHDDGSKPELNQSCNARVDSSPVIEIMENSIPEFCDDHVLDDLDSSLSRSRCDRNTMDTNARFEEIEKALSFILRDRTLEATMKDKESASLKLRIAKQETIICSLENVSNSFLTKIQVLEDNLNIALKSNLELAASYQTTNTEIEKIALSMKTLHGELARARDVHSQEQRQTNKSIEDLSTQMKMKDFSSVAMNTITAPAIQSDTVAAAVPSLSLAPTSIQESRPSKIVSVPSSDAAHLAPAEPEPPSRTGLVIPNTGESESVHVPVAAGASKLPRIDAPPPPPPRQARTAQHHSVPSSAPTVTEDSSYTLVSRRRPRRFNVDLLVVGNSHVNAIDSSKFYKFKKVEVIPLPDGEKDIDGARDFIESYTNYPRVIVFHVADNDISKRPVEENIVKMHDLLKTTMQKFPDSKVMNSNVLPRKVHSPHDHARIRYNQRAARFNWTMNNDIIVRRDLIIEHPMLNDPTSRYFSPRDGLHLVRSGTIQMVRDIKTVVNPHLGMTDYNEYEYNRDCGPVNYYDCASYSPINETSRTDERDKHLRFLSKFAQLRSEFFR